MNILYNILAVLFSLVVGYLLGSIPSSVWIGKAFFNQDPRDYGSRNAGGTNAGRLWGKKIGLLVMLIDMFKAGLSVWICWFIFSRIPFDNGQSLVASVNNVNNFGMNFSYIISWPVYWLATIGCMVGHCWPIFAHFKGGKGVAVYAGSVLFSSWMIAFIPGILYFVILKISKHVSLASIVAPICCTLLAWIWAILCMVGVIPPSLFSLPTYGPNLLTSWVFAIVLTFHSVIVIIRHSENIKRLKDGTERKISWMK